MSFSKTEVSPSYPLKVNGDTIGYYNYKEKDPEPSLGLEVDLEDGTKIGADGDELIEGILVFRINVNLPPTPFPNGSYVTQDRDTLVVVDGKIVKINKSNKSND